MANWDLLFEEKKKLTLDLLIEAVEEVMGEISETNVFLINEKEQGKTRQISISMIPDIEVSELGWSDVRTPGEQGAPMARTERELLQAYLDNIVAPGGIKTLPTKLEQLSKLAENPAEYVNSLQAAGASTGEKLKQIISFLVFYKTLTKIITNFNASSAGFSFESFLATLLGGEQIPASGATTIADFTDADGDKISLKLYAEKSVEVGGSFDALVGDLISDGKMTYLVVTKDLRGSREKLDGTLSFYMFDFTIDNVMDIIAGSPESPHKAFSARTIILPFAEGDEESLQDITDEEGASIDVAKVRYVPDEIQAAFENNLASAMSPEQVTQITDNPYFDYTKEEYRYIASDSQGRPLPKTARSGERYNEMTRELRNRPFVKAEEAKLDTDGEKLAYLKQIHGYIVSSMNQVLAAVEARRQERGAKVKTLLPGFEKYESPTRADSAEHRAAKTTLISDAARKSADWYRGKSPEVKRAALLKTNGYMNDLQFALGKSEVLKIAQGEYGTKLGKLTIGTKSLQTMLNSCVEALNTDIFSIFSDLEILSDSLNSFFAGGLTGDEHAMSAIESADSIEGKTKEASGIE